jgi:anti-sigma factor RsiW
LSMDHSDNDLLLSAYLDGELSAAEQANVEQLLATSAEARQIVDELRALRTSLQELPRHKLGPEFAEQVVKRAEQEASTAESEISNLKSENLVTAASPQPVPLPAARRPRIFNRRGIAWSVVAIAAAVVLMVTNRHADHQPGAHRAIEEESIARAPLRDKNAEVAGAAVEAQPAGELSSTEPKFAAASPIQNRGEALGQSGAPTDASRTQVAGGTTLKTETSPELQPAAPLAADRMDTLKGADSYSFGITQNSTSPPARDRAGESLEQRAGGAQADFDPSAIAADKPSASPTGTAASAAGIASDSGAAAKSDLSWNLWKAGDDLAVIKVDVSPEAARSGAFDQLLAKNHITIDDKSEGRGLRRQRSEQPSDDMQTRFKAAQEGKLEHEADKADDTKSTVRDLEAITSDQSLRVRLSDARDFDAVYVEASPEQIQATLAALANDRTEFPSVAVNGPEELGDRLLRDAGEIKDKTLSESEKKEQPESLNRQITAGKRAADPAEADIVSGSPQPAPSAGGGARGRGFGGRAGGGGFGGGVGGAGRGARGGQFGGAAPVDGLGEGSGGVGGNSIGGTAGAGGVANGMVGGGGGGSGPTSSAAGPAANAPVQAEQQQRASKLGRATRLSLHGDKTAADEKSKLSNLAKDAAQSVDGRSANGSLGNLDAAATNTRGANAANAPPVVLDEVQGEKGAVGAVAASGALAADAQKEVAGRAFQRSSEAKVAEPGDLTRALATTTRRALFVLRVVNPPTSSSSVSAGSESAKPAAAAPAAAPAESGPAKR